MARRNNRVSKYDLTLGDKARLLDFLRIKGAHCEQLEIEGSTKDCVIMIDIPVLIAKIERADMGDVNKWFRVKDNSIHLRSMQFRNPTIETKRFMTGGKFKDRPLRTGDWREGERQKAACEERSYHNGARHGHWYDYSYVDEHGNRIRVEIKQHEAWMEPNRDGR